MEYSFDRVKSAVIAQRLNFQSLKTISISFQAQDLFLRLTFDSDQRSRLSDDVSFFFLSSDG